MSETTRRAARRAIALGGLGLALVFVGSASRWADGPIGPLPGGPFASGRAVAGAPEPSGPPSPDVVELEVGSGCPRTVLVGLVVRRGTLFLPATLAPLKRWDDLVERQPAARLRIDGEIFAGRVERVGDERLRRELFASAQRKYGKGFYFSDRAADLTQFFRWEAASQVR